MGRQGALVGVMMRAGDTLIGLSQADWKKGRDRQKSVGMHLILTRTRDVDELAARARGAGITLKSDPHDTE